MKIALIGYGKMGREIESLARDRHHVKQSKRQPGSLFKAFVYSAAMDAGYGPCDDLVDQPVTVNYVENGEQKSWTPHNANSTFSMTLCICFQLIQMVFGYPKRVKLFPLTILIQQPTYSSSKTMKTLQQNSIPMVFIWMDGELPPTNFHTATVLFWKIMSTIASIHEAMDPYQIFTSLERWLVNKFLLLN